MLTNCQHCMGAVVFEDGLQMFSDVKRVTDMYHITHLLTHTNTLCHAEVFGKAPFMRAFSVVFGHSVYLPSAECFALMPIASLLERTGVCMYVYVCVFWRVRACVRVCAYTCVCMCVYLSVCC
jgi:hypothetical protein